MALRSPPSKICEICASADSPAVIGHHETDAQTFPERTGVSEFHCSRPHICADWGRKGPKHDVVAVVQGARLSACCPWLVFSRFSPSAACGPETAVDSAQKLYGQLSMGDRLRPAVSRFGPCLGLGYCSTFLRRSNSPIKKNTWMHASTMTSPVLLCLGLAMSDWNVSMTWCKSNQGRPAHSVRRRRLFSPWLAGAWFCGSEFQHATGGPD